MSEGSRLEKIISLAKRRGFIYPGSEIYGGLSGTWDYGPLGVALKENVKNLWRRMFVEEREGIYLLESAVLMHQKVWQASGHLEGFSDPMMECLKCNGRFRADQIDATAGCPECGGSLGEPRQFNMMFETQVGPVREAENVSYLRPETAQGMFVNFKNVLDSFHPKLPFGLAQVGKAFRNEIAPRDFLFRAREFELMEVEYFVRPEEWRPAFEEWLAVVRAWLRTLGLNPARLHEVEVPDGERAHYSERTVDFEYDFPFGRKELYGLAYRTDYDLRRHAEASGEPLAYREEGGEAFFPHVIEPSLGLDRTVLALLSDTYAEDELGGEPRVFLKLPPALAPVKAAVFPLLKNKPELVEKARGVYSLLRRALPAWRLVWDDNGNIGKRYRRQDEIGTPWCLTIDFQTLDDQMVTVRTRDTGEQERMKIESLPDFLDRNLTAIR